MTGVVIPSCVTYVAGNSFEGCESLKAIEVDENNKNYCSIDGVLFSKNKKELVSYPNGKGSSYIIPEGVKNIVAGAFANCKDLTSVEMPSSLKKIFFSSFADCENLISLDIPEGVDDIDEAFEGCTGLKAINVDENNSSYCSIDGVLFNKDKTELIAYPNAKGSS